MLDVDDIIGSFLTDDEWRKAESLSLCLPDKVLGDARCEHCNELLVPFRYGFAHKPPAADDEGEQALQYLSLATELCDEKSPGLIKESAYNVLLARVGEDLLSSDLNGLCNAMSVAESDCRDALNATVTEASTRLPITGEHNQWKRLGLFAIPVLAADLEDHIDVVRSMWHFGDRIMDALRRDDWLQAHSNAGVLPRLFLPSGMPENLLEVSTLFRGVLLIIEGTSPLQVIETIAPLGPDAYQPERVGEQKLSPAFIIGWHVFDARNEVNPIGDEWTEQEEHPLTNKWERFCEGDLRMAVQHEGVPCVSLMRPTPVVPHELEKATAQLRKRATVEVGPEGRGFSRKIDEVL